MIDEGYIKFNCMWKKARALPAKALREITKWRNWLHELGFIGVYPDGIGFGNVSIRIPNTTQFIITGTQTGGIAKLAAKHYTKVTSGNFEQNALQCEGPVEASSESLTHLAVYQADKNIHAIIHTHHPKLWKKLLDKVPTTFPSVAYGTPEMAHEIFRLFKETDLAKQKILVMAGHEDGLITFGCNLDQAGEALLKIDNK
ncbi:MAG: class II aldolase/adducin family protein [Candidatus Omnitrophica bacterium]|nr:class II aldolase/adducin family protein [Candidatus Omnitrophota bacterium]